MVMGGEFGNLPFSLAPRLPHLIRALAPGGGHNRYSVPAHALKQYVSIEMPCLGMVKEPPRRLAKPDAARSDNEHNVLCAES